MECNGSCYLKDQLKLQDDTERKIPGVLKEKAETVFFLLSASSDFAEYIWAKDRVVYKPYLFPVLSANQYAVFHPPETV